MPSKQYQSLEDQQRRSRKRNLDISNLRRKATWQEKRDLKNYKRAAPTQQLSISMASTRGTDIYGKKVSTPSRLPQKRRYFGNAGHTLKQDAEKKLDKLQNQLISKN